MKRILILLLILLQLLGHSQTRKVLFIGNSYTFFNDMPVIIANLASSGGATLNWQSSSLPGYTLQQHSNNSTTLGLIQIGGWDYVVLQEFSQYPSEPLPTVEVSVYPYARFLHSQVNSYNASARTMFYMTWGRRDGDADRCARLPEVCTYIGMDDLTRDRYMYMAQDNQAEVSPVGAVWRYIRQNYPSIELYGSDGSHPSEAGSYAAACSFYAVIFRKNPALLTYDFTLTATVADNIRKAAKAVVFDNLSNWYVGAYDIPDYQAPTAPTGLNASNMQQTGFTLNWTASTDNVGIFEYNIYRNGVQIATSNKTNAVITGLMPATTYAFTVKARDVAGNFSASSAVLNVTTTDAEPPTPPTGLSTSNLTETSFTLSWTASTDNVGVTGYDVYRNGVMVTTVAGTTANISGLAPSTAYSMTVRAKDEAGNASTASTILNVTTPDTHAPTVPAGLSSANITQTSFTLNWTASTDNVGVTGYEIYRNGAFLETVTSNTIGITGLTAGSTYSMSVRAKDAANNLSASSTALNITTLDAVIVDSEAPTAPTGLTVSNLTQTSLTLSWTASTDNIGVTGYIVYKNGLQEMTVTGTSASIAGLNAVTNYAFTVKAKDAANNLSTSSSVLNVTTPDSEAPAIPAGLFSGNITETSFTLGWSASSDNIGVTGYDVYQNGTKVTSVTGTAASISGLSASTTYAMTVRAKDAAGNVSASSAVLNVTTSSSVVTDNQSPTVPAGLASSNISQTSFTLSWTASTDNVGVTGYDVYQDDLLITTVAVTTANISGLTSSTTYAMKVRAKDAAGNTSAFSAQLNVTTLEVIVPDAEKPSTPSGLASSNITEDGFTLNWTASTDNIGVVGYDVYRNGTHITTVTSTTVTLTGLNASTTYSMYVIAKDAAGNLSDPSSPLSVTTLSIVIPDNQPPSVPGGLSSTSVTETGFRLSWTASSDNVGVTGYDVYRNGSSPVSVTNTFLNVTGLNAGTTYAMTVRAKDAANNYSAQSSALNVTTADLHAPSVPSGLSSANITETSFTLSWNASSDNVGVTGYDIYRNGSLLNTVTNNSMNITGLSAGTTYAMTIRAKDAAGNVSASSSALNVTTADLQAPTAPTGLTNSSLTQSSFTLSWTASTDNVGVTGYNVYRNGSLLKSVTGTSTSIDGLSASTSYSMSVRARDAAGNLSSSSSTLVVTTPDSQAPTVPSGLSSGNIAQSSFTLSWTASSDNVAVTGYDVYLNGAFYIAVTGTTVGISGLSAYTPYSMTVRAKDAANNVSAASNALIVTTLDSQAPTVPTGLAISNLTQSSFRLNWTASTDNVGVTGYYVYQNGSQIASVSTNSANISGLKASTTYTMTVRARDAAGNSSALSTAITVTTPDTEAPSVPSGLKFSDLSQTGFTLTWNASSDNVSVTGYDVYRDGVLVTSVGGTAAGIINLSAFRTYVMTVRAKDAAGNVSASSAALSVTTPDTEGPTAPTGLNYTNLTQSGFTLNWTASTDNVGIAEYQIFDHNNLIKTVTGTTANITGLAASKTYPITVRAKDPAGNLSPPSSVLNITTPDTEAPTRPTGLNYTHLIQSGFTLNWTASTDNVGITAYEVYMNDKPVSTVTETTVVISGLLASRKYAMKVRAKDAAGNLSEFSNVLSIITPDTEKPSVPTGLAAKDISETGFTLTWSSSTDNVGVVGYEVYKNGVFMALVVDTTAEISGLAAYKIYSLGVKAKDAAGNASDQSNSLNVRTLDIHSPTIPAGVFAGGITDSTFTLTWVPSEDNVGVAEYDVYCNGGKARTVSDTIVDFTGLTASKTYKMTVIAKDSAGNASLPSSALSITTPDSKAPSTPTELVPVNITQNSFFVKWCASHDNVGVVQYKVFMNDSLIAHVADTMAGIKGLTFNTRYLVAVRAQDAAGNISEFSNILEVTTSFPGDSATITIFPNPVIGNSFFIDLGRVGSKKTKLEILDLDGNLQFSNTVDASARLVEISGFNLEPGFYFIRIICGGSVYSRKILIASL